MFRVTSQAPPFPCYSRTNENQLIPAHAEVSN